MKHIEYYEADDGTRFDCMWECEAYEDNRKFPNIDEHLKIFDEDINPIKLGAVDDMDWQNDVQYYIIYSKIGYDYLEVATKYSGIRHPYISIEGVTYPRVIEYQERSDEYVDVEEEYLEHKKKYDKIMSEV